MTAVGSWKVTLATPMGPQAMTLYVTDAQAGSFAGWIESAMGTPEVAGQVRGSALSWTMEVTKPVKVKVGFEVTVDGDRLSGTAKAGIFGKAPVSGERIAAVAPPPGRAAAEPQLVTEDSVDPQFGEPYIKIDEQRTEPEPHRYVHGGFKGTDARFSFYFPPKARYQGRFFHNTYPLATTADIGPFPIAFDVATGDLGFTFDSGAYYVQTNLGGADRAPPADPAIGAYRVNAAAAKFSRKVAAEMYGAHRPYGYIFGGSGGSYQVMGCAENTDGVWDGFVPFVVGSTNAIPNMFSVRMHALRVLRRRDRFPAIMDAINPGGSGDPYAELDVEEAAALREASRLGFPPRGWFNHAAMTSGYFSSVAGVVPMVDPTYVEDFWSKPGYLGAEDAAIRAERFTFDTTIEAFTPGFPHKLVLASVPDRDFADAHVVLLDGPAAGKSVPLADIDGRSAELPLAADPAAVAELKPGVRVRIDNAWPLALQTYQRHQVPTPDLYAWDQYRGPDGQPLHPQRELLVGPLGAAGTAGALPAGRIHGKMLVVQTLMDIDALAWQADWYRSKVRDALGERFDDSFALWFIDHAQHDDPQTPLAHAHTVSFAGALQQALRDLATWVETGVKPAQTRYAVEDAQVLVPAAAADRGGVQPVVDLRANGGARAEVAVGEPVAFTAVIATPPGAGQVVAAEWDFEGVGTYPVAERIAEPAPELRLTASHAYDKPGTYFPVLRAASQRQGDAQTPYGRLQNLGRVRVVVS